jgi:hypothetical protein
MTPTQSAFRPFFARDLHPFFVEEAGPLPCDCFVYLAQGPVVWFSSGMCVLGERGISTPCFVVDADKVGIVTME